MRQKISTMSRKVQTAPLAAAPSLPHSNIERASKPDLRQIEDSLMLARRDMKVEVASAILALVVGTVILEITLITVLHNLTGWTLFWVGFPGFIVSVLLLYVVYVLLRHKNDLEKVVDLVRNLSGDPKH